MKPYRLQSELSDLRCERRFVRWRQKNASRNAHGNLAEFGPALVLFFIFMLIPMLALIRFGLAASALYFIVSQTADSAARAPNYALAKRSADTVLSKLITSPLGRISGLRPESLENKGLYVDECVIGTGEKNVFGPDKPLDKTISPAVNTYEYEIRGAYTIEPLLSGVVVPFIGSIPLLGRPTTLTVRAVRAVEYPDGLGIGDCSHLKL
jgi:hypothetical protein